MTRLGWFAWGFVDPYTTFVAPVCSYADIELWGAHWVAECGRAETVALVECLLMGQERVESAYSALRLHLERVGLSSHCSLRRSFDWVECCSSYFDD